MSGPNAGQPDPTAGGVYNKTVEGNTSNGNGATGIGDLQRRLQQHH